jgi:hypothetical protein
VEGGQTGVVIKFPFDEHAHRSVSLLNLHSRLRSPAAIRCFSAIIAFRDLIILEDLRIDSVQGSFVDQVRKLSVSNISLESLHHCLQSAEDMIPSTFPFRGFNQDLLLIIFTICGLISCSLLQMAIALIFRVTLHLYVEDDKIIEACSHMTNQ